LTGNDRAIVAQANDLSRLNNFDGVM